jgi:hypothetical protein
MATEWYVQDGPVTDGPITGAELVQRARQGNITPDTLVARRPDGPWARAVVVKGLFSAASTSGSVEVPRAEIAPSAPPLEVTRPASPGVEPRAEPRPVPPVEPEPPAPAGPEPMRRFVEYQAVHWYATRGGWVVPILLVLLLVPLASFLKPLLGVLALARIAGGLAAVALLSRLLHFLGCFGRYYFGRDRVVRDESRSLLAWVSHLALVVAVPLGILAVGEFFTPRRGALVTAAPQLRAGQETVLGWAGRTP